MLGEVRDAIDVLRGLRHLLTAHLQEPTVDPDRHDLMADRSFGLGDLVLVVWELVVVAAGVDVEPLAEVLHRHRRALDMPAGEAVTPGTRPPEGPVGSGLLPEREILRVALRSGSTASSWRCPARSLIERVARELPVARERRDVVVHGPVDLIGVALRDQRCDQIDHLVDVVRRPRVQVRTFDPHQISVLQERLGVLRCDLWCGETLVRLGELHLVASGVGDLVGHVSDVGDVHDPLDPLALVTEGAPDQVAEHERAHVPDVDVPVDGGTARVDLHGPSVDRDDLM